MIPNNKEHREAHQEEVNNKRKNFLEENPDQKTKHEAIDECNKILSKAGIPYMGFFYIKGTIPNMSGSWQFNNLNKFTSDSDKMTDEDRRFLYSFYSSLSAGFLSEVLASQKLDDEAIRKFLFFLGVMEEENDN